MLKPNKLLLLFLLSLALCCCLGILSLALFRSTDNENEYDFWENVLITESDYVPPMREVIDVETDTSEPSTLDTERPPGYVPANGENIPELYANLKKANSDTVGWMFYPGLFSMPVMYSGDNKFYLGHNEYKNADKSGALFLDSTCSAGFSPAGLIHGHNLNKPSGFGQLTKLRDSSFFRSHREFWIYDGEKFVQYRVFSLFAIGEGTQALQTNFTSKADRERYISWLCDRSVYGCSVPVDSNIIQLNTCDYAFKGAHLIVAGYKV